MMLIWVVLASVLVVTASVFVPPRFTNPEKMERQKIIRPVNSTIRLTCKAVGNPQPNITWMKDQHYLYLHGKSRKSPWTLRLRALQQIDSGYYRCFVKNSLGSINFTYHVEVTNKIRSKPIILNPYPLNKTVCLGAMASFRCKVRSEMQPHVQWLKQPKDPNFTSKNTIIYNKHSYIILRSSKIRSVSNRTYISKFVIHNVTETDKGMYICVAFNTMGLSWRNAYLHVRSSYHQSQHFHTTDDSNVNLGQIIGVSVGIHLAIIVVVIAYYVYRRRRS